MSVSEAWLLEPANSPLIAISDHQMVEFVQAAVTFAVPGAPAYCNSVLFWQNNFVPIMDLGVLLGHSEMEGNTYMNLIAYQDQPGTPLQYLALRVNKPPEKIQVDDARACEIPEDIGEGLLNSACLSSFMHGERPVIILDITRLCSVEFRELANPQQNLIAPRLEPDATEVE